MAVQGLDLPGPEKRHLLAFLRAAERAFKLRDLKAGLSNLERAREWALHSPSAYAQAVLTQIDLIARCVNPRPR